MRTFLDSERDDDLSGNPLTPESPILITASGRFVVAIDIAGAGSLRAWQVDAFAATGAIHELRAYTRFEFDREGRLASMRGQLVLERGLTSGKILRDSSGAGKNHLGVTAQQLEQWKAQRANRSDIEARFGPPTAVHRHDAVRWMEYSRSPSSSSYLRRWIGLDGEGRFCFKLAEAHAD